MPSFQYWDENTPVTERQHHFKGHELTIIERIRAGGGHLIYKHEITGPGNKHDERQITLDIPEKHES